MTREEAAEMVRQELDNPCQPPEDVFTVEAVRVLLEGYEANKPRPLTLREVQCYQDCPVLWLETGGNDGWRDANQIINFYAHPDSKQAKQYGVTWRCWTLKPTGTQSGSHMWLSGPNPGGEVSK